MKHIIKAAIVGLLVVLFISMVILPVLNLSFAGIVLLVMIFAIIFVGLGYLFQDRSKINHLHAKIGGVIFGLACAYLIIGSLASSAIFRAETKRDMLHVEEVVFDETVPNIDMDNLIIWDESDAIRFGEKLITEKDPSLGSMYTISKEYGTLSVVQGKPYWLFPLEHSGFFKYIKNQTIPGYIKVNATTGDAEFVDKTFKVAPSAYFFDDLKRVCVCKT